jgi:hypothetical protein
MPRPCLWAQEIGPAFSAPAASAPYARYETPDECVQAGLRADRAFWRDRHRDTARLTVVHDTLVTNAVATARRCAASLSLSLDHVTGRHWLALARLRIALHDTAGAAAAVDQFLTAASHTQGTEQAQAVLDAITTYLDARPAQLRAAWTLARRFGSTASDAPYRFAAYVALGQRARVEDNRPLLDSAARMVMAIYATLTPDQRRAWEPVAVQSVTLAAYAANRRGDQAAAKAFLDQGSAELPRGATLFDTERHAYTLVGTRAPAIEATYWFNTDELTPHRPAPNALSLLVFVRAACGVDCYGGYGIVRRFARELGPSGLDVTLVSSTVGWYDHAVVAADSEAALIRTYFVDRVDLPVPLAVVASVMQTRQDGRRFPATTSAAMQYQLASKTIWGVLVDRTGIVRAAGTIDTASEAMWTEVIRSLL